MRTKKTHINLLICTICSAGFVTLLFALSENSEHRDNSFTRRFLDEPVKKIHEMDLIYNSYDIAGVNDGQIYISNPTSPLDLMILDTSLQKKKTIRLRLDQDSLPFRSIQLSVVPPYFFLIDGTIPYILRGSTTDWKAHTMMDEPFYFDMPQPIDSTTLGVRTISKETNEYELGKIALSDSVKITHTNKLLQKQVDGIFDTDGILHYNNQLRKLVYTYYYRNQYIVADDTLQLKRLGNTIDSISHVQLKLDTITSKNQRKMAAPPQIVNKYSATYGKFLFINSKILGRDEPVKMWRKASVIDVYDLMESAYLYSFYIDDIEPFKLKKFQVLDDKFIGMIGTHIVTYQLNQDHFKDKLPVATKAIIQK